MNYTSIILLALLIVVLVIVGPFITIWALNTIFPILAIPTNIWTWLAVLWIHILIGGSAASKK